MGLFGKKAKAKDLDDSLDIPPPPPVGAEQMSQPVEKKEDAEAQVGAGDIPPLPSDIGKAPDIPGLPDEPEQFKEPEKVLSPRQPIVPPAEPAPALEAGNVLPPEQAAHSFEIPPISSDLSNAEPIPEFHENKEELRPFDDVFSREEPRPAFSHAMGSGQPAAGKQIFVELSNYKKILKDIDSIKRALKQSDAEINELISDIKDEEETFSGIHSNLNDVEDKLVQLERTLFNQ